MRGFDGGNRAGLGRTLTGHSGRCDALGRAHHYRVLSRARIYINDGDRVSAPNQSTKRDGGPGNAVEKNSGQVKRRKREPGALSCRAFGFCREAPPQRRLRSKRAFFPARRHGSSASDFSERRFGPYCGPNRTEKEKAEPPTLEVRCKEVP